MDHYITGPAIRALREGRGLTQQQLAQRLCVSDKAVSKWETSRGLPDVTLLEPLAAALGVSLAELLSGERIINTNRGANLLRSRLYLCPLCGNVLHAAGPAVVSCCGIALPPLEAEDPDPEHLPLCQPMDGEYYISLPDHPMTKEHYISFIALWTDSRWETVKLYPEGPAQARFAPRGGGVLLWYCNRHGLFRKNLRELLEA